MKANESPDEAGRRCPVCGAEIPAGTPLEECPKCLLRAGLPTEAALGPGGTVAAEARGQGSRRALPGPGDEFGHYRILGLLGQGGMGAVFEAEDMESGRTVALKVLSQAFDSPEARKRFLREGRLAASINHSNSVYVFGTEEIAGTPVIAMERVSGGTLQQRVESGGPLPPAQAVDAILQIIAGLEAAQALGILHRDVKPSNCFEDADGTVKVGDFGLSISTAARAESDVTLPGALVGTPAYSSPEQLRGEELNLRSDIYAVGVTLFFLLTGRTPFAGANMVHLIATVLEKPAPLARDLRPEVPAGLARVVGRCLEKLPAARFGSYDEFRQALVEFSSTAPQPAPLGLRFGAGLIDMILLGMTGMSVAWLAGIDDFFGGGPAAGKTAWMTMLPLGAFAAMVLYYAVLEGVWGASLGKAMCRLRVVGEDRLPPGGLRAGVRAALVLVVPALPYWILTGLDPLLYLREGEMAAHYALSLGYYVLLALLFVTMRQRNGWAAVHDLLTRTRVIRRVSHQARPGLSPAPEPMPATESARTVGPYHVIGPLAAEADGEWLLGYDTRLLRGTWIRVVPPGTEPVPLQLRNLGRAGRLRWIAGRRTPEENWDAFEAVSGAPLLRLAAEPLPWSQVRFWLADLATELAAAERDGNVPGVLALDRVWITAEGRAKLLDFPGPGSGPAPASAQVPPPLPPPRASVFFLAEVARVALGGSAGSSSPADAERIPAPLPLHAGALLARLRGLPNAGAIRAALESVLHQVPAVTRLRRAGIVVAGGVLPVVAAVGMLFGMAVMKRWEAERPELAELARLLQVRSGMRGLWQPEDRGPNDRAFAIYIAAHHRDTITDAGDWNSNFAVAMIQGESRRFAERSVAEHPNPAPDEVKAATEDLRGALDAAQQFAWTQQRWLPLAVVGVTWLVYVGIPALLAALLFRGGLILIAFRVAVVRRDGSKASRLRLFWRSLIAWAPLFGAPVLVALAAPAVGVGWAAAGAVAVAAALVAWSVSRPDRSLPDRVAGTVMVMR